MLWSGDVDHIDCGQTYYQMGSSSATRRRSTCTLQARRRHDDGPGPRRRRSAGLRGRQDRHREDQERASSTRRPIRTTWSPRPTSSTRSSAASSTASRHGFTQSYFGDLEGAKVGVKAGTKIPGIETPDDNTIVLKFKRAGRRRDRVRRARLRRHGPGARGLREEVRRRDAVDLRREPAGDRPVHDRERRLRQGDRLRARQARSTSSATRAGTRRSTTSRRTWTRSTTSRATTIRASSSRRILTGESMINGDFSPLPENLKDGDRPTRKEQLMLDAGGGGRWISLNTTIKPFDDLNVRKAVMRRHGPQRAAADPRRQARRRHRDALPPAGHGRLRGGRRHEGHRRGLPLRRRRAAARRSPPSTSRPRATRPASTRARRRS